MSAIRRLFFPLFLFAILCAPTAAFAAGWVDAPRAFVELRDARPRALSAFADRLEAAGGHASVIFASGAALVYGDDAVLARPEVAGAITSVHRSSVDDGALAALDPGRRDAAAAWNFALTLGDLDAGTETAFPEGPADPALPDAGPRPVAVSRRSGPNLLDAYSFAPYGADYYDTSEFMAGRVAVGVWMLDDSTAGLSWNSTKIGQTLGGVESGLDNWVRKGGAPTFLTFFIDPHINIPVSGIPIKNPMSMDTTWVNQVLGNLGWTGADAFEKCFAYNHSIRDIFGANWCYSIFIADSNPNVLRGLFAGVGYAWAYFGGPWVYMSRFSSWAYNYLHYYAVVPMHESGHIFMDTDEYDTTVQYGGYLNAPDNNGATCIMNANDSSRVCPATRNQLGWRDLDGNGVIEPLDVPPRISLTPVLPNPTTNPVPTWSGHAGVMTLPNHNPLSNYIPPHAQTIVRIVAVECRLDGGPWSAATASDGAFDGYDEDFTWRPAPLAPGTHVIEARSRTSVGIWSAVYASDTLTVAGNVGVGGAPGAYGLTLLPPEPNPVAAGASLRFTLPTAGHVRLEIMGVDGRRVRTLVDGDRPAGAGSVRWDGRDDAGRAAPPGVYVCRIESRAGSAARRIAVVR
jgi:hypothetical protein